MNGTMDEIMEKRNSREFKPVRVPAEPMNRAFVVLTNIRKGTISQQDVVTEALEFFVEHYPEFVAKSGLARTGTEG